MVGGEQKKKSVSEEEDLITRKLPIELVRVIISLLPINEAVRTCVLSKKWNKMWKKASHLNIDQSNVLNSLIRSVINLNTHVEIDFIHRWLDEISRTEMIMNSLFDSHVGPLQSCTIRLLPETCASGKAVELIKNLFEKNKVKNLSMECDDIVKKGNVEDLLQVLRCQRMPLELPFVIFSGFKALELNNCYLNILSPSNRVSGNVLRSLTFKDMSVEKNAWEVILSYCLCLENLTLENVSHDNVELMREVIINSPRLKSFKICKMVMNEIKVSAVNLEVLEIDTVVCKPQNLTFETPRVRVLRSSYDLKFRGLYICWVGSKLLQSRKILQTDSSNQSLSTSSISGIFENLATLCIHLDLKTAKNAMALFSALKSCPNLQNIEINSQVNDDEAVHYYGDQHDAYDTMLYNSRKGPCECIDNQLKTISIKGFVGVKPEVEFLKHIITTGEVMKKITIWFVDDCPWPQAAETNCLLSFPNASPNLSIVLNPGPVYMAKVDNGNFITWLLMLSKKRKDGSKL